MAASAIMLPNRLGYPELIPAEYHKGCLYDNFEGLMTRLRAALTRPWPAADLQWAMAAYDGTVQAPACDDLFRNA